MHERSGLELSTPWFATFFRHVWKNVIARQYEAGALNGERALQAHLVAAISVLSPELDTLVEPRLSESGIFPDLLVYRRQSLVAVAVIELKYVPYHSPEWEKDVRRLLATIGTAGSYACTVDPKTGKDDGKVFCDPSTLGIFAAVGARGSKALDSKFLYEKLIADRCSEEQSHSLPRLLHAWGTVDREQSSRTFGAGWLMSR